MMRLHGLTYPKNYGCYPDNTEEQEMQRSQDIHDFLMHALQEDMGRGDMTSMMVVPEEAEGHFRFVAREQLVLCGTPFVAMLSAMADERLDYIPACSDGTLIEAGGVIADVKGPARSILTMERVALNLMQHLSGVASLTALYCEAVEGTGVRIVDTRKTIPGLRDMQKYAVRCGGGHNHRLGLDDGVMIKDNHIAIAGSIAAAMQLAREGTPLLTRIEVECDTLEQVSQAVEAGADMVLLDNMPNDMLLQAVALAKPHGIGTEASGNVSLETVRAIAETGVDVISVGKLTHSVRAVDIGLDTI
jgi:nicotinate-nucleotide pyrophosphorylase (carboxylating)